MEFIAGLMSWVLILGAVAYIVGNVVTAVKTIVARKRAKGDDEQIDEKECDNSN